MIRHSVQTVVGIQINSHFRDHLIGVFGISTKKGLKISLITEILP